MNIIEHVYPAFVFKNDCNLVYKSCEKNWIVVMRKDDCVTNESRTVKNPMFAKYRANRLFVVKIFNKLNPLVTRSRVSSTCYNNKSIVYHTHKYVEENDFDQDVNNVCSTGIHYFKSATAAFYFELPHEYTGPYYEWSADGVNLVKGSYTKGEKTGTWISYYSPNHIIEIGEYQRGRR